MSVRRSIARDRRPAICAEPIRHRLNDDQGVVGAREMGARTRPSPISRLRSQPRAHGIEAHSADGRDQVRLVHRDGGEAALKQVPGPAPARIDEVGVAPMCLADGAVETIFTLGHHNEVDVVGHQTVGPDRDARPLRLLGQEIAIDLLIAVLEEDRFAAIAALRDVVGETWDNDARAAGHGRHSLDKDWNKDGTSSRAISQAMGNIYRVPVLHRDQECFKLCVSHWRSVLTVRNSCPIGLTGLLVFFLASSSAEAIAQAPLTGAMRAELSTGGREAPGVIVSVTVTNNGNTPLCINAQTFPYISQFYLARMRLVNGDELGWSGVDVGEATPEELGQSLHMVVVVRPQETLVGFTNIARTYKFLRHGLFEIDLEIEYANCSEVAARKRLASAHMLPLQARFNIPETWPGVRK